MVPREQASGLAACGNMGKAADQAHWKRKVGSAGVLATAAL